ncbi:MAG: hypothetical protein OEY09_04110 [Gammaproteobacteria bacterium]|nr:hypothetical protein [Gammaproteobacteria bacterium]
MKAKLFRVSVTLIALILSSCSIVKEKYAAIANFEYQRKIERHPYDDGAATKATFDNPFAITIDTKNDLYVTESQRGVIRKISKDGSVITLAQTIRSTAAYDKVGADACFYRPTGIVATPDGSLYITHSAWSIICKISADGTVTLFSGQVETRGHQDGDASIATLYNPLGISVDKEGDIYIVDNKARTIRKISKDGNVLTIAGISGESSHQDGPVAIASFSRPHDTAVDSIGNIYVTDFWDHTIRKIGLDSTVTTLAGSPDVEGYVDGVGSDSLFNVPLGITIDRMDNIYVADRYNHVIRKITPRGKVTTYAGAGGISGYKNGIYSDAKFNLPSDLAMDSFGNLFVVDSGNKVIRKITPEGVVSTYSGVSKQPLDE